ncbi:MAG TPA: hypothetical protein VFT87_04870 [Candidatus Saccharimonadales bacterium]|nr:hypothetical protein [Candidatus Saccharimonadales bacterium]
MYAEYIPRKNRWVILIVVGFHLMVCAFGGIFAIWSIQQIEQANSAISQMTAVIKEAGWEPDNNFRVKQLPISWGDNPEITRTPGYIPGEPLLVGTAPFGRCTTVFAARLASPTAVMGSINIGTLTPEYRMFKLEESTFKGLRDYRDPFGLAKCFE